MRIAGRYGACALLLLVAALALPVSCKKPEDATSKETPTKLKVTMLPYTGYAPFFIAEEEGFFREQGLEVEYVQSTTSNKLLPLLARGDLDVFAGALSAGMLNAISRGANIRIVADKGQIRPSGTDAYVALVMRSDLAQSGRLDDPAQWKGLRIGRTSRSGSMDYLMHTLFRSTGVAIEDLELPPTPNVMLEEAFANDALDGALTGDPWTARLIASGKGVIWKIGSDVAPGMEFAVIAFGPNLLKKDTEAGERFMVAYFKALRQYNEGKTDRNVALMAQLTELDAEFVRKMTWPYIRGDGRLNIESIIEFQKWAMGEGALDRSVAEEEFWEPHFTDHALRVLNHGESANRN